MMNAGTPFQRAIADCRFNEGVTDDRYKIVFHSLRHTFASWLAQDGVSLTIIAELMGHSTIRMTQRYAKLSPDSKKDAVNRVFRHLSPASGSLPEKA
jgi:integrase